MQHLNGHQQFHRRALEKRQIRRVTTTVVTEPETTFTSTFTTRVPLIQIPGLGDDEDEETTTTSRRSSSSSASSSSSTRPASSSAATARPTASSSVVPSSAISSAATSRPTAPPSSSESLTDIVTSFVTETNSRALPTTSDIASNSTAVGGAKSAGQVAGIVVGVLAGVIGVAIFAAFIVRHMKKRANDKEAWDAAKFRQSALLLNDEKPGGGGAGRGGPRPPSMIERREGSVMNVPPPSRAYPYTDVPGSPAGFMPQDQLGYNRVATPHQPQQQYGAPNPYGAAPMAYTGQNMYGQGAERGYGGANMNAGFGAAGAGYGQPQQGMEHPGFPRQNGAHNSLPPFASYAPRLEMDGHSFGPAAAVGNMSRTNTTASALPNPFSEHGHPTPRDSSSAGHGTSESGGQHTASGRSRFMTRNGDEDDAQDQRDAPPAYIDDGSYAKMQRDVKTPVVMSVEGNAPTPAPVTPPKPTTPAPAPAPTSTTPAPAVMGNNKARPMSSHTVYDPSDAYGGM